MKFTIILITTCLINLSCTSNNVFDFIPQNNVDNCGTTSLSMIFNYYNVDISQDSIINLLNKNNDSIYFYSMLDLYDVAERVGFKPMGYEVDNYKSLQLLKYPAIAHYSIEHFVVIIQKPDNDSILIADPADTIRLISNKNFNKRWSKNVLIINK